MIGQVGVTILSIFLTYGYIRIIVYFSLGV